MIKVHLEKECSCFKKSKYVNDQNYTSKKDALLRASLMKNYMNNNFCKKHIFTIQEQESEIIIKVVEKEKELIVACGGDISFNSLSPSK